MNKKKSPFFQYPGVSKTGANERAFLHDQVTKAVDQFTEAGGKIKKLPHGRPTCEPLPGPNLPPQKVDDGSYERYAAQETDVIRKAKWEELQKTHADKKPGLPKRTAYEAFTEDTVRYVGKAWRYVFKGRWFRHYQKPDADAIPKPPQPLVRTDPGHIAHGVNKAEDRKLDEIYIKQVLDGDKSLPPEAEERTPEGCCPLCGSAMPTHHADGRKIRKGAACSECAAEIKAHQADKEQRRGIDNGPGKDRS
jgi:hypothetical protein